MMHRRIHKLFTEMEPKNRFARRDRLISLESRAKQIWEREKYFVAEPNSKPKYFLNFPFPYMNGKLHLGHAFSMTKCDFNAWYKHLAGFNVLFPFAFHCTGMPISAAAKRITYELQHYGNPPKLPKVETGSQHQYDLMLQLGVPPAEIDKFTNANYWIDYFTPLGYKDIFEFGVHVDGSRSFVTTQKNPYFDSFIRWQFNVLKEKGYIKFGTRPSIYSPKDKQMCADHDRTSGEGVVPQQFTLIKLRVHELNANLRMLVGRKVYLVAATLRPQTMYGQTACFLLPSGEYHAIEMKDDEVFICSARAANNMAYQNMTRVKEQVQIIASFKGEQLMGIPLVAPLALHKYVYSLPMMTISMNKGTGVVSCVPSDSPDDYMAISDLKTKEALRKKYAITEDMVGLQPVQIISTPTYGNLTAVTLCESMKIKSQNDKELLEKAKDESYKKGFFEGTMIIGQFKGIKVADAKQLVKKLLVQNNGAVTYYQPNGYVQSRSGNECVVSYCEQWYINYADEAWKARVMNYVKNTFKCNNETLYNDLIFTINWLREWGCSRSFGLGTRLPFDQKYLIESLSDSTIYFAYYTICHMLQGDIMGSRPGILGIRADQITHDMWSYIFLDKEYAANKVPRYKLDKMRQSFKYWYPLDLRCSAKDLIKNHLTMALFNHAAIWDDEKYWPRAYYCNGYINVEAKKMSKSTGNFITLEDSIKMYGADATRLACAMAGDSINDANFTAENANASIMQLSTFQMFLNKTLESASDYRTEERIFPDTIFEQELENQIHKVHNAYELMVYRDVVKHGLHDLVYYRDIYILNCLPNKPNIKLILRYIYLQLLFLYPLSPHFCQTAYLDYFLPLSHIIRQSERYPPFIGHCKFPHPALQIDHSIIRSHEYYLKLMVEVRQAQIKATKSKKVISKCTVIFRREYQQYQLQVMKTVEEAVKNKVEDWRKEVKEENKEIKTKMLKFGGYLEKQYKSVGMRIFQHSLPFNEEKVLAMFRPFMQKEINLQIQFAEVSEAPNREHKGWSEVINSITPGNPTVVFD